MRVLVRVVRGRIAADADGASRLKVGDKVRYALAPDPGEKGPQASTVVRLPP